MPATGFQAIILCGPGESLNPFNSNPKDFPKALIPIANRPMIWYPLEWCCRLGITNVHLVTPLECRPAIEAALSQNPYLTSLPSHKPTILAPEALTFTTGTAEIFRLPEVQSAIVSDFIVLPCDIVCDLHGSRLLEIWMTMQAGLEGGSSMNSGGEQSGGRGGLGVWYQTKNAPQSTVKEEKSKNDSKDKKGSKDSRMSKHALNVVDAAVGVKNEETDFIITAKLPNPAVVPPFGSLRPQMRKLVTAMPTDTLRDELEKKQSLHVRHALLRKHGELQILTTYRDAHLYFFPYWVKEYMRRNESFDSIGEDVLGWWAKATWQDGLANKLSLDQVLQKKQRRKSEPVNELDAPGFDLASLSSTNTTLSHVQIQHQFDLVTGHTQTGVSRTTHYRAHRPVVPPILSYIHPAPKPAINSAAELSGMATTSLIRRVDTVPLLLSVSLALASLPSHEECAAVSSTPSPLCHWHKIHPSTILPSRLTHTPATSLLDANITILDKITVRDCVIGANCIIKEGSRLSRCLLMEGAVVEEKCVLSGCVLGRRVGIGKGSELVGCTVQEGYLVAEGTVGKDEVFAGFAGSDSGDLLDGGFDDEEDGDQTEAIEDENGVDGGR